jgi:hypothetical protein
MDITVGQTPIMPVKALKNGHRSNRHIVNVKDLKN